MSRYPGAPEPRTRSYHRQQRGAPARGAAWSSASPVQRASWRWRSGCPGGPGREPAERGQQRGVLVAGGGRVSASPVQRASKCRVVQGVRVVRAEDPRAQAPARQTRPGPLAGSPASPLQMARLARRPASPGDPGPSTRSSAGTSAATHPGRRQDRRLPGPASKVSAGSSASPGGPGRRPARARVPGRRTRPVRRPGPPRPRPSTRARARRSEYSVSGPKTCTRSIKDSPLQVSGCGVTTAQS